MNWEVTTANAADKKSIMDRLKQGTLTAQDLIDDHDNIQATLAVAAIARYHDCAAKHDIEIRPVTAHISIQEGLVSPVVDLLITDSGLGCPAVYVDLKHCWIRWSKSLAEIMLG